MLAFVVIAFACLGLAYGGDSPAEYKTSDYSNRLGEIALFGNSQLDTRFYVKHL